MNAVTLAVLAGGEGSRMGAPKALLRVGDQPILEYLVDRWNWEGPTLLVTAPGKERPPGCPRFDAEAIDAITGEGPMRGILTALEHCQTDRLVVVTCDMPLMTREILMFCAHQLESDPRLLGCMLQPRDAATEPFPLALRAESISELRERLHQQRRSVRSLASMPCFEIVKTPKDIEATAWTNINTPADWNAFNSRRKHEG